MSHQAGCGFETDLPVFVHPAFLCAIRCFSSPGFAQQEIQPAELADISGDAEQILHLAVAVPRPSVMLAARARMIGSPINRPDRDATVQLTGDGFGQAGKSGPDHGQASRVGRHQASRGPWHLGTTPGEIPALGGSPV